ncbi:hypothetical protein DL771_005495 [Monosporascus sp. 5C6A]|nr:hypothetical protein DL771_005495 [Monosporascus sp. 5C6A]
MFVMKLTILDYGDVQTAWHTIGLASTAAVPARPKPNLQQIRNYLARLLEEVSGPPASAHASSRAARWRRMKKVMMAARTLLRFRFEYFEPGLSWPIILANGDVSDSAIPWAAIPAPLPFPAITAHINARRGQLANLEIQYRDAQLLRPSVRQLHWNRRRTLRSLRPVWDGLGEGGFKSLDGQGFIRRLETQDFGRDGNSLWYALYYFDPFLWDRGLWLARKYHIWRYFNYVIHHPSHDRHRLYVHLERQSSLEIETRIPGITLSILRALHENRVDAGPPMYGSFRGMMQVIADYFQVEVILFLRPNFAQAGNANAAHAVYDREVYGSWLHGQLHGQLMLVTDADKREHYQVVTHYEGVMLGYDAIGPKFDTSGITSHTRWGWMRQGAPFIPDPIPNGWPPTPLPFIIPSSGVDARFTLDLTHNDWKCFEGRTEAVASDFRYGRGRVPNLPDPVAAGWDEENQPLVPGAPGPNAFPYDFGPHLITSGVYTNPPNVLPANVEFWPRWTNIKSYEAHKWQEEARGYDILTTPQRGSQDSLPHPDQ